MSRSPELRDPRVPAVPAAIFRALLQIAERDEVIADLEAEYGSGFQRMAAYRPDGATLETTGAPMQLVEGMAASAELFDVLGAAPMLGRTFRAGDDATGAQRR